MGCGPLFPALDLGLHRETTPWYSWVRIFRQYKLYDWSTTVTMMATQLNARLRRRSALHPSLDVQRTAKRTSPWIIKLWSPRSAYRIHKRRKALLVRRER